MHRSEGYLPVSRGVRLFYQRIGDGPAAVLVANGLSLVADFERFAANGRSVVFLDGRRGRSELGTNPEALVGGIERDVEDFEAVRRHFGFDEVALIGHSYCALTVVSYASQHAERTSRVLQLGPPPPVWGTQYPRELSSIDETFAAVMAALQQLESERTAATDPVGHCRRFMTALRPLYVTDPADVDKIHWDPCAWPSERAFMHAWSAHVVPSLQRLDLSSARRLQAPVLIVHGRHDRSTPYGGGRAWARLLPNARLLTVNGGGHMPWIEAPQLVLGAIETFLAGGWPKPAQEVSGDAP